MTDKRAELYVEAWTRREHGLPLSRKHVGALLGLSRERIRQIEMSALGKIKAYLMERMYDEGTTQSDGTGTDE